MSLSAASTHSSGASISDRLVKAETEVVMTRQLTAVIEREGDGYVALCPEVDVASQGPTVYQARVNLREALEPFFETASEAEIRDRFHGEIYITRVEMPIG